MGNLKVKTKLILLGGVIILLFISSFFITYFNVSKVSEVQDRTINVRLESSVSSNKLGLGVVSSASALRGFAITKNEALNTSFQESWSKDIYPSIEKLNELSVNWTNPDNKLRIDSINKTYKSYREAQDKAVLVIKDLIQNSKQVGGENLATKSVLEAEMKGIFKNEVVPKFNIMMHVSTALSDSQIALVKEDLNLNKAFLDNMSTTTLVVSLLAIIILIISIILIVRSILKDLGGEPQYVSEIVNQLALGKLNVNISSGNGQSNVGVMKSVEMMIQGLTRTSAFAKEIGSGNLEKDLELLSSEDELGKALIEMKTNLLESRENTETAQREIDARSRLLDQVSIVSETDLKGYITYVNDKFCEVAQYTREELIGQNHNIVRHPDMPKDAFKALWATVGRGEVFRALVKNKKKDGTPYYVDGVFAAVLGTNGKPVKYIGIRYDITEETYEKQAALGIVAAIDNSYAFIDNSYAFIEYDTTGNVVTANDNFLRIMEYSLSEIKGKNHSMFVDNSTLDRSEYTRFWNDLNTGIPQAGKFTRLTKSGKKVVFQSVYSDVKDDMGRIIKVVNISTDITVETEVIIKNNEDIDALKREIDTRMKLVDEMCIVSETDLKGYITYVNDLHCEVSQYSREELIGANQNIVRHPDMSKDVFKELWATVGRGQVFRGPVKNRKKDGTPYYVDGVFAPVLGANGKPIKYIGVRYENTQVTIEKQASEGVVNAINASYAFVEFDVKGNIITANQRFLNLLEYSLTDVVGKHHRSFVDPSFANSADYQKFWDELGMGISQSGLYKRFTRTGKVKWLQAVYSPVKDEMGRIVKIVRIATDVTEATEAATDTQLAAEEATRVLASLSEGDLTQKYAIETKGNLKVMGESLNKTIDTLSELISVVVNNADNIASASTQMSSSAQQL